MFCWRVFFMNNGEEVVKISILVWKQKQKQKASSKKQDIP